MNIEEAKQVLDKIQICSNEVGYTPLVETHKVKGLLDQVDQPQPEVPQCVADWYEKHKDSLEYCIWEYITEWDNQEKDDFFDFMNYSTFKPIQTLVNMHQFGYTIQKEKLYTVEISNPNSDLKIILVKVNKKLKLIEAYEDQLEEYKNIRNVTESEIRKDFDWAWQFRKDVENE